jgi:hypothetical protein
MPFQKGISGNVNGRPPKTRAIAENLEKAFKKSRLDVDGKNRSGMAIVSNAVVTALVTGRLTLDGEEIRLEPKEWIDLFKYSSIHVDGPVKAQLELSTDKDRPLIIGTFDYAAAVAEIATGSSEDSESSGED